jgi:DNA-binding CsgD family transcriptional regulator
MLNNLPQTALAPPLAKPVAVPPRLNYSFWPTPSSSSYVFDTPLAPPASMADAFRQQLEVLDSLRFGVLVVTREFDLIYQNRKVQDIFATLETLPNKRFPSVLITYCQQFMDEVDIDDTDPLVIDCQPGTGRLLRWNISWMSPPLSGTSQPCLLVVLEDCYQDIMSQMRREQKRYYLTDREAEIWQMIRLKCSYQEIADGLGITLNTVKTHVKNIYGKIREQPHHPKTWFLDHPERRG